MLILPFGETGALSVTSLSRSRWMRVVTERALAVSGAIVRPDACGSVADGVQPAVAVRLAAAVPRLSDARQREAAAEVAWPS